MTAFVTLKQHLQGIPDFNTQRALLPWLEDYEGRFSGTVSVPGMLVTGTFEAGQLATFGANVVVQGDTSLQNGTTNVGEVRFSGQTGNGITLTTDHTTGSFGWHDMTAPILTRTGGGTAPTFASYIGNIYQWSFPNTGEKECFQEFHMRHDYVPNSDIFIHTHWSTAVTATGNVVWKFEATFSKGFDQEVFNTPIVVTVTDAGGAAFRQMVPEVQLSEAGGEIRCGAEATTYSITATAAVLTCSVATFTAADIGRTIRIKGAGAAGANHDTTISAFTSTTQVTLADNAVTTVNAVADKAFWRVLDTSLLQTDGLILVRTSRDSGNAADTIDQVPFLHTVDIHYQSTGLPTYSKVPDFYAA